MIVYPNFQRTLFFTPGYSLFKCKGKKWIHEDEPAWWQSWWAAWKRHLKTSFICLSQPTHHHFGVTSSWIENRYRSKIHKNICYPNLLRIKFCSNNNFKSIFLWNDFRFAMMEVLKGWWVAFGQHRGACSQMVTGRQAPRGSSELLIIANPFFIFL